MKYVAIKNKNKVDNMKLYYMKVRKNHNFIANDFCLHNCGYRGTIQFTFRVLDGISSPKMYEVGDRIGQLIILPYPIVNFIEVDELSDTVRGEGGFGSTGN